MSNQYACPVEGCEYAADSIGSVKGHITRKGGTHKGMSGPDMEEEITVVSVTGDTNTDNDTDTDTGTDGFPANPDADTDTDTGGSEVDLPCGHESFNPADAPDGSFNVTCDTCGNTWGVTL